MYNFINSFLSFITGILAVIIVYIQIRKPITIVDSILVILASVIILLELILAFLYLMKLYYWILEKENKY